MKQLMFSLLLIVLAVGVSNAQMATSAAGILVTGTATGIGIEPAEAEVSAVVSNTTYSIYYSVDDGASMIAPIIGGEEAASDLGFAVTCDPFADVALSFVLPTKLLGAFTVMPINFTQAVRVEDLSNYNPNVPLVINGGVDGLITLFFNYTITVPKTIEADGWAGTVVAIASYL